MVASLVEILNKLPSDAIETFKGVKYAKVNDNGKSSIMVFGERKLAISNFYDEISLTDVIDRTIYCTVRDGDKQAIMRFNEEEEWLSNKYDYIDIWEVEDNNLYGVIKKNGKAALMKLGKRGKEILSNWHDDIVDYEYDLIAENGTLYAITRDNNKDALIVWDGEKETVLYEKGKISELRVEDSGIYAIVRENDKAAFMKLDRNGKKLLSKWYDDIKERGWDIDLDDYLYGVIIHKNKTAFIKWNGKEEKISKGYDEILEWRVDIKDRYFKGMYAVVIKDGDLTFLKLDGEMKEVSSIKCKDVNWSIKREDGSGVFYFVL